MSDRSKGRRAQCVGAVAARACRAICLAGVLVSATHALDAPKAESTELTITLAPQAPGANATHVDGLGVTLRFGRVTAAAGAPLLRLPLVVSNVDTVATQITDIAARDDKGALPLTSRDVTGAEENARDALVGGPAREWLPSREPSGAVVVHYTTPAHALPPRGPAPPFAFSDDAAGLSAAGHVFIVLPPGDARYQVTAQWDHTNAPRESRGISSFGEGLTRVSESLTGEEIREGFFMTGQIHTWPALVPKTGFFSAWQGEPSFDASALMGWTAKLYGEYSVFFEQKAPPPYGVFLRYNPINAGGGVGLHHSFVMTFGEGRGSQLPELKDTLAHEMFHTFQPYLDDPQALGSSWFGEGLAVLYANRLSLRFHAIGPADFLKNLNFYAARYYTSLMAGVPNSEIPKRFWADTRIRTLPYDRGMLYLASIDDALRKASHGSRSLDELVLDMVRREHTGQKVSVADWEMLLREKLGESSVQDFRAFLAGREPQPASDAFGPCFRRTSKTLRRYEVGFDPAVLAEPQRIVRGLVPGSAAEKAGLRNGDEIMKPVPQDGIQGTQDELLALSVRRGEAVMPIRYLPRGETVSAIQWERAPQVPDERCAL